MKLDELGTKLKLNLYLFSCDNTFPSTSASTSKKIIKETKNKRRCRAFCDAVWVVKNLNLFNETLLYTF